MTPLNDKIIILKVTRYSEDDLVVRGLTPSGSRESYFAKSALKSKKRFGGGVLEPTHYVRVEYKKSSSASSMNVLREASLIESFSALRKDYDRLQLALHFVNLVDRVTREDTLDSDSLFDLLGNGLKSAQTTDQLNLLRLHFETKLLAYQGVLPPLEEARLLMHLPIQYHTAIPFNEDSRRETQDVIQEALARYLES